MTDATHLLALVEAFPGRGVLVVGDVMLDEFIFGQVSRISPEAPVPVVEVTRRSHVLGGAANTAANVAALGLQPALAGLVGDDAGATQVRDLLAAMRVDSAPVVTDPGRSTTAKTRIVAGTQQVVRIDHETQAAMTADVEAKLLAAVRAALPGVQACVLSDYGKGVVTPSVAAQVVALAAAAGVPTVIDPKGVDYAKYRGATVVKPNQLEAGKVLNRDLRTSADVDAAGRDLVALLGPATAVLVTRGPQGMSLFQPGRAAVHIPTLAREVYDVTGAGDTVAAVMAATLAAGGDLEAACQLATAAAAVVVGKVGTATCTADELRAALAATAG
jgi:rfaE bifunctional protein kinase chain/domain